MDGCKKIFIVAVLVLCGCGGESTPGNTLELALETSPNRLDPALAVDVAEGQLCALLFQGLVRFAVDGKVVPDLAKSWRVEDDGRRYVFQLDRRARFSDGSPVLPNDVVRSFQRVLAPASASSRQWVLERIAGATAFRDGAAGISGVDVLDDSTLALELTEPFRPFLQLLAMPAARVSKPGDTTPGGWLGSGRWLLAEWQRGDYLLLTPNPFHPAPAPGVDRVRMRIIPEAFTRIAEFESGSLDVIKIPSAELNRFINDPARESRIQSRPELRVLYMGLNNRRPPLDDARVRRALNMAVDVDQLIKVIADGQGVRSRGAIPPTLAGYREREAYRYNPAGAKRLLAEAGVGDGFQMDIWQRNSPDGNRLVEAVQGYLSGVGVKVNIVKREWSAFKEAVSQGKVDAFFLDWYADYPDGENFLYPLFHSSNHGGGGNRAFFTDPNVDKWIELSQKTVDAEGGTELYARADSLIYRQAPWLFLYFPTSFVCVGEGVSGYTYPVLYLAEDFSTVQKN